jgi:hypothetical protein
MYPLIAKCHLTFIRVYLFHDTRFQSLIFARIIVQRLQSKTIFPVGDSRETLDSILEMNPVSEDSRKI